MKFLIEETIILWAVVVVLVFAFYQWISAVNRLKIRQLWAVVFGLFFWASTFVIFHIVRRAILEDLDSSVAILPHPPFLMLMVVGMGPFWMLNYYTKKKLWHWDRSE